MDEVSSCSGDLFFQSLACQAFHPFYVFQIASIILWSLDKYYYYAVCIFTISAASITTTVMETRSVRLYAVILVHDKRITTNQTLKTMKRLREISRFECDIMDLRNGFCEYLWTMQTVSYWCWCRALYFFQRISSRRCLRSNRPSIVTIPVW